MSNGSAFEKYPYKSQQEAAGLTHAELAARQRRALGLDESDGVDELHAPPRKDIPAADRELLELAARALGADFDEVDGEGYGNLHFPDGSVVNAWNPLQFSGDALELAVKLRILVDPDGEQYAIATATTKGCGPMVDEPHNGDPLAATRRAITRAAAEIGKVMA